MIELFNCDSLEYMRSMSDKSIDLIVTDPPYEIEIGGGGGTINTIKKFNKSLNQLTKDKIDCGYDIETFNKEFVRIMKSINIYIWCNKKQIPKYFNFYVNERKCKFDIICWHLTNALPTYSNKYLSDTEYCLHFFKGKGKTFPKSYIDAQTFYISPKNQKDKKLYKHPTIKPLDLTRKLIRNSSEVGDIVFDPFMGSGTTAVACKLENRNFIGCELLKKYYDVAIERINI